MDLHDEYGNVDAVVPERDEDVRGMRAANKPLVNL